MNTCPDHKIEIIREHLPPSYNTFLDEVIHTANSAGVQIQLINQPHVYCNDETSCAGYFIDSPIPTLSVACDKPKDSWFQTLIHESCHMDQWIENSPYWTNAKVLGIEAVGIIELWVQRYIEMHEMQKWHIIRLARNLELDCERRAVRKIRNLVLPVDIEAYARGANAYVLYYNTIGEERAWYKPGKAPYELAEVLSLMPSIVVHYDEWYEPYNMSPTIKNALRNCLKEG